LLPDQAPVATQAPAFLEDHVRVVAVPLLTVLGAAERLTVGAGALTDTTVDCVALPPGPVQERPYVAFAVMAPVDCEPAFDLLPDQAPKAVQEVALVEDQVKLVALPLVTVLGFALMLTVAVGFELTVTFVDCVALPPLPVQVNE
jgi:hypothetical protein